VQSHVTTTYVPGLSRAQVSYQILLSNCLEKFYLRDPRRNCKVNIKVGIRHVESNMAD